MNDKPGHMHFFFSTINKAFPNTFQTINEINVGIPLVFKRLREKSKRHSKNSSLTPTKNPPKKKDQEKSSSLDDSFDNQPAQKDVDDKTLTPERVAPTLTPERGTSTPEQGTSTPEREKEDDM